MEVHYSVEYWIDYNLKGRSLAAHLFQDNLPVKVL
jgi:hypothetical protein